MAELGKSIFQKGFSFIDEVIVTEVEICLKLNQNFNPSQTDLLFSDKSESITTSQTFKLPIYFSDHPDWEVLEEKSGHSKNEIISKLTSTNFSIAMFGFLPGFIYFDGLESSLQIPRKSTPAKYVKANSLAIGGKYLGLYSIASPGGWYVVGYTPIPVLQIPNLPPVVLNLGDTIILQSIEKLEYERLLEENISLTQYNSNLP